MAAVADSGRGVGREHRAGPSTFAQRNLECMSFRCNECLYGALWILHGMISIGARSNGNLPKMAMRHVKTVQHSTALHVAERTVPSKALLVESDLEVLSKDTPGRDLKTAFAAVAGK